MRQLGPSMNRLLQAVVIAFAGFQLYTAGFGSFPNLVQRSLHVMFALLVIFLLFPARKRKDLAANQPTALDFLAMAGTVVAVVFVMFNYNQMLRTPLDGTTLELWLGAIILVAVLEATRRTIGPVFPVMTLIFLVYAYYGWIIPGDWGHSGFSMPTILDTLYRSTLGIWGGVTGTSADFVAMFVLFGALLMFTDVAAVFFDIAMWATGWSYGGPAKIASIASAFFGMVSGSATANVATTGTFTIPLMIRTGYPRPFAAAAEAVASTGGQLMPPIMGAGAFLMAEILGIPYSDVVKAAVLPAICFYISILWALHVYALRYKLKPLSRSEMPPINWAISGGRVVLLVASMGVLLGYLFDGYSPQRAGFAGFLSLLIFFIVYSLLRGDWRVLLNKALSIMDLLKPAMISLAQVAAMLACAQIITTMIDMTGIGIKMSDLVISASGGLPFFGLLLAMVGCIILGMGLPAVPAYSLGAAVLAPSLITMGFPPLTSHLFVFYFTCMSSIVPPVCASVFVASGMAEAKWTETARYALLIGAGSFLIPFVFAYSPGLLLDGSLQKVLLATVTTLVGFFAVIPALVGHDLRPITWLQRLLYLVGGLLLIAPGFVIPGAGLATVLMAVALHLRNPRTPRPEMVGANSSSM